jgi:putative inorganic carbon (HCO3(-)) transporter
LIPAAVAVLPLACWPAASRPFSEPKLWTIAVIDVLIGVQYLRRSGNAFALPSWPWLAFIAMVSLSAVTAPFLSPAAFLLFVLPLPLIIGGVGAPRALCVGSGLESAIVVLQLFGHDPFQWLGWQPEPFGSSRMRMYGTLGNPDFVAAWLSATLPLCALMPRRSVRLALAGLQLAAIFCTGSRVLLVAMPAALLAFALVSRRFEKWWLLAVPLMCAVAWFSPARSLGATVNGRLHLAAVTAAHVAEVPVTGYGPGAFEMKFAAWQQAWMHDHPLDRRFQGPVDHAHNDYLEFWVEYGPLGLGAFLAVCGSLFWRLSRRRQPGEVAAALGALLAIALVDFPFHRPAEWALFTILAGVNKEA